MVRKIVFFPCLWYSKVYSRYHCEILHFFRIVLVLRKAEDEKSRLSLLLKTIFLLALAVIGPVRVNFAQGEAQKAVMIIANHDFRDEELLVPKNMLETNRIKVVLASNSLKPARGVLGTVVKPDLLIKDVQIEDYDALIFIGGSGAKQLWDDQAAHQLAVRAMAEEKIIGAICIAPVILARAGALTGKKATVYSGAAEELEARGIESTAESVTIDDNLITASGPDAAGKFAEALVIALTQNK